jgi:hypothetical protein
MIEDVQIIGCNGWLNDDYRRVLASLHNLRSLNVDRYCLADFENDSFVDETELRRMLEGWPRIEEVHMPVLNYPPWHKGDTPLGIYCRSRGCKLIYR